jgi:hypothetical protein
MQFLLYIDPGSSSYLVQLVIGAILGISMFFKAFRMKVRSLFYRKRKSE